MASASWLVCVLAAAIFTAVPANTSTSTTSGSGSLRSSSSASSSSTTTTTSIESHPMLECGTVVNGSTIGRPNRVGPAEDSAGEDWYMFCPNASMEVRFSTCGSRYDTLLRVLDHDSISIAACDDCGQCDSDNDHEEITIATLVPGSCYYVVVDGRAEREGNYSLSVTCGGPPGCPVYYLNDSSVVDTDNILFGDLEFAVGEVVVWQSVSDMIAGMGELPIGTQVILPEQSNFLLIARLASANLDRLLHDVEARGAHLLLYGAVPELLQYVFNRSTRADDWLNAPNTSAPTDGYLQYPFGSGWLGNMGKNYPFIDRNWPATLLKLPPSCVVETTNTTITTTVSTTIGDVLDPSSDEASWVTLPVFLAVSITLVVVLVLVLAGYVRLHMRRRAEVQQQRELDILREAEKKEEKAILEREMIQMDAFSPNENESQQIPDYLANMDSPDYFANMNSVNGNATTLDGQAGATGGAAPQNPKPVHALKPADLQQGKEAGKKFRVTRQRWRMQSRRDLDNHELRRLTTLPFSPGKVLEVETEGAKLDFGNNCIEFVPIQYLRWPDDNGNARGQPNDALSDGSASSPTGNGTAGQMASRTECVPELIGRPTYDAWPEFVPEPGPSEGVLQVETGRELVLQERSHMGAGGFGQVCAAMLTDGDSQRTRLVVAKRPNMDRWQIWTNPNHWAKLKQNYEREVKTMEALLEGNQSHLHIVPILTKQNSTLTVVTESYNNHRRRLVHPWWEYLYSDADYSWAACTMSWHGSFACAAQPATAGPMACTSHMILATVALWAAACPCYMLCKCLFNSCTASGTAMSDVSEWALQRSRLRGSFTSPLRQQEARVKAPKAETASEEQTAPATTDAPRADIYERARAATMCITGRHPKATRSSSCRVSMSLLSGRSCETCFSGGATGALLKKFCVEALGLPCESIGELSLFADDKRIADATTVRSIQGFNEGFASLQVLVHPPKPKIQGYRVEFYDVATAREAVKFTNYSQWLRLCSDELRDNRNVVVAAILEDGKALQYASERLRDDVSIVALAADHDEEAVLKMATPRAAAQYWTFVGVTETESDAIDPVGKPTDSSMDVEGK